MRSVDDDPCDTLVATGLSMVASFTVFIFLADVAKAFQSLDGVGKDNSNKQACKYVQVVSVSAHWFFVVT